MLFDSHAHYDDARFDGDRDALLTSLASHGVGYVANIGADMKSSRAVAALAARYAFCYAAVGVHPHDAKDFCERDCDELAALLQQPRVTALGEIGLDYHYDLSERDVQRRVFARQMELARALRVPVVIHEREALVDTLSVLRAFPDVRGVLHCFSGSVETAREVLSLGYMISFGGVITFKNARRALDAARFVPDDRLLLETDCPYLAPEPCRGQRNDSTLMRHTAERLAELRGVPAAHIARVTTENALRFYATTERS